MTDHALARNSDPQTSHDAAASVPVTDLERAVLDALKTRYFGMTLDEICEHTRLDKVTASPRLKPLCQKGLVIPVGKRPGRSGRSQTVWCAT